MTRIVLVTVDKALNDLAEKLMTAQKLYESLLYYVNKTSLAEMMEDETGKIIIKELDSASSSISYNAGVLLSYAQGDARLGTEKEWMDYVDQVIARSGKYTQEQLDEAVSNAVETATKNAYQSWHGAEPSYAVLPPQPDEE